MATISSESFEEPPKSVNSMLGASSTGLWMKITSKRAFADTTRGQIHYRTLGSGKPVVLLHQTPRSSDEYLEVLEYLGQRFKAFAMDTIGFGDSYTPQRACTIEDYAEGVIDFLDALGIQSTSLVGHHTGSVIALEVAASYPNRVKRLVLSACPYYDDTRRRELEGKPVMDADEVKEDGSHLVSLWQRRMSFYPPRRPDLLTRFMADALVAGENRVQGHKAVRDYRMEDRYEKISCPTLLICGTADPFAYPVLPKVAQKIKTSRTLSIPGGTVALPDQMPKEFSEAIMSFLSESI